jgi:flagellar biosynthesis protein FlhF
MKLETFVGADMPGVLRDVRAALGDAAMIVHTSRQVINGRAVVEVVAASAMELEPLCKRVGSFRPDPTPVHRAGRGPRVVALIGPTGAGKTTTAAKLALHPAAFGAGSVGFLGLDTYRVAALEQLQTYADIMGAPLEVAYDAADVPNAMAALADRDVVIVDAPGRSPAADGFLAWRTVLSAARPHEVYLVLPATIRPDVAAAHRSAYRACGLTDLIVTKLDEMVNAEAIAEMVDAVDLPVRWVTDGQNVPDHLHRGGVALFHTAARAADAARVRLVG